MYVPSTLYARSWVLSLPDSSRPLTPHHCSPPGSSVHVTLQARILEWIAIFSSRESS